MAESVNIRISPRSLLFFAVPTILVFVFQNIYSLVDLALASNLISTDALSAINIDAPVLVFTMAVGQMIAIGASALIGKRLGEGRKQQARENFSLFMVLCIAISAAFCVAGLVFREPIIYALGARGSLYDLCEDYLIPLFLLMPVAMGGVVLSVMFILSGKPHLGLFATIAGGLINIVLDYVLMGILGMGVAGAAYACGIGYTFQTAVGLIYFMFNRRGDLYFVRPRWEGRAVVKAFANGSSEMVTSLAVTVKMIALNIILMDLAGSDGVAAGAIVVNIQMLLSAAGVPVRRRERGCPGPRGERSVRVLRVDAVHGVQHIRIRDVHCPERREDVCHPLAAEDHPVPADPALGAALAVLDGRGLGIPGHGGDPGDRPDSSLS